MELGENLATIAWGKLADYPEARVLASSFEKWPLEQEALQQIAMTVRRVRQKHECLFA